MGWLPSLGSPFEAIRTCVLHGLAAEHNNCDDALSEKAVVLPIAAQKRIGAFLWRDARQQLLAMEDSLRVGSVDSAALVETGRTLLNAAVTLLRTEPKDAQAAL